MHAPRNSGDTPAHDRPFAPRKPEAVPERDTGATAGQTGRKTAATRRHTARQTNRPKRQSTTLPEKGEPYR